MPRPPRRLRDRPTVDLIFLTLAMVVGLTVLSTTFTILLLVLIHPEADTSKALGRISAIVNTLVGAVVGYAAGTNHRNKPNE